MRARNGVARLVAAAGLAVDAFVHWHLAPGYDSVRGDGWPHITQGQLFRVEAVLAVVALILVLALPRRWTAAFAFVVAAGGVAAVVLYTYVNVGAIGPIPNMYEPMWYLEKTLSAVAEGIAAVAALVCLLPSRSRQPAIQPRKITT
jgi:glucan phosphoethanolaminetransferase (alkaline phosphatase superfamily)